jgi:hypothetical protein
LVALDEFAVAFRIAAAHGGDGGLVLLVALGHLGWCRHLTARQRGWEIVTEQKETADSTESAV